MTTATIGAHSRPAEPRWTNTLRALASGRRAAARAAAAAAGSIRTMRQAALTVTGLGLIDASAFHATTGVGLLVTGVSVLTLEFLTSD